jgi:hypothetical protein
MRIFIFLLVLANLLYLGINYFTAGRLNNIEPLPRLMEQGENSLTLLSERELPRSEDQPVTLIAMVSDREEESSKQLVDCVKIVGDWDQEGVALVKQQLNSRQIVVNAEGKERRKKVNYWVIIPPFANKQEAITAKRQLQTEKIMDTFIIKSGSRENALSLGLYSKEEGATRRAEFVNNKRLGIARADIEELTLYVDRYWIKVVSEDGNETLITETIGDGIIDLKADQCEIER